MNIQKLITNEFRIQNQLVETFKQGLRTKLTH